MAKDLRISLLLDFYGDMLTEKQRDVVELYYNEDLSLAEIAAHSKISRQGVRDSIKRGEATLLELEERLGLARRFRKIQRGLNLIAEDARFLRENYGRVGSQMEAERRLTQMIEITEMIND